MCSRYVDKKCSVCSGALDKNVNRRIIVEICGHQKCRECFIKEEDGCSICQSNSRESISNEPANDRRLGNEIDAANEKEPIEKYDKISHIVMVSQDGIGQFYKCLLCKKSFKSRNNRKYHLFCDKTQSKPHSCEICHKRFITQAHLKYHQSTHDTDKRFSCPHCSRIYSGEIALKKHLRKHKNDFKYECEQCTEKFIYKEQLNLHRNRHNDVYYECPDCRKRFLVKSNFTKHLQSHSGANRRTCPICGNNFSGSSALKTHMLTHSNSKSHKCDRCEKKFIDHRSLERHQKTHSDENFFECTLCSAKSNRRDNIRRHVRNLHSSSEQELQIILEKIVENFTIKRNRKSDKTKVMVPDTESLRRNDIEKYGVIESTELEIVETECVAKDDDEISVLSEPMNNTTSVIKFAGRVNASQQENLFIDLESKTEQVQAGDADTMELTNISSPLHPTDVMMVKKVIENPIAETPRELPSMNYEPLTFDPFPDIAPLPLINTNNLSVYRQLLSPYLKKTTNNSTQDRINSSQAVKPSNSMVGPAKSTIVIDRPPKKMIEKYEIYRN